MAAHRLQLNIAEAVIALKIKSLDDALGKAIQQMQSAQLKLAVLVRARRIPGPLLPSPKEPALPCRTQHVVMLSRRGVAL